jgi:hydroxyacylglutathione hydrolase
MPVIATSVGNAYSHLAYLVACEVTGEATAIDPFHIDLMLEMARSRGFRITRIVNTHEHWDHAGRNDQMRAETGATVAAAKWAAGVIEKVDHMLVAGDVLRVGTSHELEIIETPGHTMTHISLLGDDEGRPFLLCGDTVFGAGVGNCGYGGHAPTLFETVETLRTRLAPETILYPGHDYLARNLGFTLAHEADNAAASELLPEAEAGARFTSLAEELGINLFLRLDEPELRQSLVKAGHVSPDADRKQIFIALRRLRDTWS